MMTQGIGGSGSQAPVATGPGWRTSAELATQPDMWRRAAVTAVSLADVLPAPGEPVVVLGCGTSYYIGEAYARRRVAAGIGRSRAAIPSELDEVAGDDVVVLLSRSGTTGDLVAVAAGLTSTNRVVAIVADAETPIADLAESTVLLDYADESSVMQTRFATTSLALLRASLGEDMSVIAKEAEAALVAHPPMSPTLGDLRHVVFLGHRWSVALAHEAALKIREAAGFWTEAYPIFEYQHGPISCAGAGTLVWSLTDVPASVADDIRATGASLEVGSLDAQAELVRVHRLAVALALREGRDPDAPPHLSRSVRLSQM